MIITKKHLPRRTFLRSAMGAMVAMPFLDAMVPALSAAASSIRPIRFGAVYVPNGIYPQQWHPEHTGSGFEFKPIMQPLEPYRSHLVTLSGMKAPDGNPDMGGVHMGASAAWLNGWGPVTDQAKFVVRSKKSIDQYVADKIAEDTPLRSLEVGTEDMGTSAGACDGYPCVFFNAISWRDETSPLPVAINPRVTFERMFGEAGSAGRRLANMRRKQSLLDSVTEDATIAMRAERGQHLQGAFEAIEGMSLAVHGDVETFVVGVSAAFTGFHSSALSQPTCHHPRLVHRLRKKQP